MANFVSNALGDVGRAVGGVASDIASIPNQILGGVSGGATNGAPGGGSSGVTKASLPQGSPSAVAAPVTPQSNTVNSIINQGNAQSAQIASLLKSIQQEEQANAPGVATSLNLNALNAQAQSAASNTVNPLYTQYLNQYLQEEAANQQAAQSQNTLNIQQEQGGLTNTLQQNQLAQNAAANTNALTQGNVNVQQQNYELTAGNAQNQKLQAIEGGIGTGNLGSSGIGQQQIYNAENASNIANAAQRGEFQYQRDTSNLSAADTFAQLAQSSAYATTAEGQQEAQSNFNLNDYLRQAAYNDSQYRQSLAASQQQAITATTQQNEAQYIQQQIAAANPAGSKNYAASEQAYSNLLSPSLSLPSAPSQSDYLQQLSSSL